MGTVSTTLLNIESITGDIGRGGWECTASFINAQGYADYSRRAEVFWLAEGLGVWDADWRCGLRGFILPQSVTWDRGQGKTDVTLATSHVFLENAGLQGMFFSTSATPSPSNKHQAKSWTLGGIIKHIVSEHTNITDWVDISGIETTNSTSINYYTVQESDSMWDTIKRIGDNEFYVPYFTKSDRLVYNVHPMFASTLPEPVVTFDSSCIIGQPRVEYRYDVMPDQVQLYALTDDGKVLTSFYPDNIASDGRRHKVTNIRCNGQARLDQLAHQLYMFLQRRFRANISIAGAWGLSMELYDRVEVTYSGTSANGVQFVWDQKKFWVSQISVRRVHDFGAVTELVLDEENFSEGYFYSDYT